MSFWEPVSATFAIPDCRTDEGRTAPFLYPRKLYVDNAAAIMAGKVFYAMNKSRATMDWEEASFTGSTPEGLSIDAQSRALTRHPNPNSTAFTTT